MGACRGLHPTADLRRGRSPSPHGCTTWLSLSSHLEGVPAQDVEANPRRELPGLSGALEERRGQVLASSTQSGKPQGWPAALGGKAQPGPCLGPSECPLPSPPDQERSLLAPGQGSALATRGSRATGLPCPPRCLPLPSHGGRSAQALAPEPVGWELVSSLPSAAR